MTHVSHHELVELIEKAFEAIGMRPGERAEAAEAIAWLELHNLNGIDELSKAIRYIPAEASGRLAERYRNDRLRVFSAGGHSILSSGALAVDAVLAMAARSGLATVHVEDCRNRGLITGFLLRAAHQRKSVLACWSNRQRSQLHNAWLNGTDELPQLRTEARSRTESGDQSITLIASEAFELRPDKMPATASERIIHASDPDAMRRAQERAFKEGIVLPDDTWHTLKTLAAGVLVDDDRH